MKIHVSLSMAKKPANSGRETAIRMRISDQQDDLLIGVRGSLKEMAAKVGGRFYVDESAVGKVLILRYQPVEEKVRRVELMFGFLDLSRQPLDKLDPKPLLRGRIIDTKGQVLWEDAPQAGVAPDVSTPESTEKMAKPLRRWMQAMLVQLRQLEN